LDANIQKQSQPFNQQTGAVAAAARATLADAQVVVEKVGEAVQAVCAHVEERSEEAVNQAKQQVSAAYQQANKRVNEQYEKAVAYGHGNPGTATLLTVGIGIGIGLLVAGCVSVFRNRE
jgi:ElaB/YqjD/DUF883 family membrane-anchored ribosome-binding protein